VSRAEEAERFALACLTYRGPLTVQQIADIGGADDWGLAAADTFRRALYALETSGEVVRRGRAASQLRGPKPWLFALAETTRGSEEE